MSLMLVTRMPDTTLLAGQNPDARRRAAEELAASCEDDAVTALAAALEDESKGVRDAASRSLCTIGGDTVARAIVGYLSHEHIVTRNLAAEILVKLGVTAIPAVVPFLGDGHQDTRKFAVDILGLIGSPAPTAQILPLLDDPDLNVVVSAVEALGNMKSGQSLHALFETYDRHTHTRPAVAEALGKIAHPGAEEFLLERLRQSAASAARDPLTPFAIIEALAQIGSGRTLNTLRECFPETEGKVRSVLLHAMVRIAGRTGFPLPALEGVREDLLRALNDDEIKVRVSGATWLVAFDDPGVTRAFIHVLGHHSGLDAVLVPALCERKETCALATEELNSSSNVNRKALITLLGRLVLEAIQRVMHGSLATFDMRLFDRAFDAIAAQWTSSDEESRAAIVDTLFRLDGDRAVGFLDDIMNQPDPWLRMHVIEVIAAIADRRAPDFIARFLDDDDDMVRELALGVLEARGYDRETQ